MKQIIEAVVQTLKEARDQATEGSPLSKIRSVYLGDPILIPESNLPALVVVPMPTSSLKGGTNYDLVQTPFRVKYVQNIKDDLGSMEDDTISPLTMKALEIFANYDPETKGWNSDCLLYTFRPFRKTVEYSGLQIGDWRGDFSINYEFTQIREFIAFEAYLDIIVKTYVYF